MGAGATAYSEYANPARRPPLSNEELLRMFKDPIYCIPSIDNVYDTFFSSALKLYDYDMESLFTGIYMLANHHEDSEYDNLLELEKLGKIINDIPDRRFSNLLTIFQAKLLMEIQLCIGTHGKNPILPKEMPICSWHRKIVKQLKPGDIVVSFNYDLILPYALINENKLSAKSFLNPYIREVYISEKSCSDNPIIFITPHGSFAWQTREKLNYFDGKNKFHASENFFAVTSNIKKTDLAHMTSSELTSLNNRIDPPCIKVNLNNRHSTNYNYQLSSVILPLKKKTLLFEAMPHFKEEYNLFINKLKQTDEIYLIGKNFNTSDQDIAEDIMRTCSESANKHVVYANPDSSNNKWIEHHDTIFNATSHECYKTLEDCATQLKP